MQKTYQTFYARYFEKINIDSLTYYDDEQSGRFTTREYYTIPNVWEIENATKKIYFSPFVISAELKKPADLNRTMPFYIKYPARYQEEIIVNLPEDWNFSEMNEEMNCSAFTMRAQAIYNGRKMKLKYTYESLKDHVLPSEANAFFKEYKLLEENVSYMLSKTDGEKGLKESAEGKKTSSNTGFIIIAVLLISGLILWWTQRR
jgi:hypothetical protein